MPATKQKSAAGKKPTAAEAREANRRRIVEAAAGLVREVSFSRLTVGAVMEKAGLERTIFYRHFDDLVDLMTSTGRQAIEELFAAQAALADARIEYGEEAVREAVALPVGVYHRHGPVLRAVSEAAAADERLAANQTLVRDRFDELIAGVLAEIEERRGRPIAEPLQTARALNRLAESYLLDAFGREARTTPEAATDAISEIWVSLTRP